MQDFLAYLRVRLEGTVNQYRKIYELTLDEDGPQRYEGVVRDDLRQLEELLSFVGRDGTEKTDSVHPVFAGEENRRESGVQLVRWQEALQGIRFQSLPGGGKYRGSEEKRSSVKAARDRMKAQIKEFAEKYFASDIPAQLAVLQKTGAMVRTLVDVTKAFSAAFAEEKAKKNILDFSDLEHMALRILVDPVTKQPTEAAAEYRQRFREVMIDEYQDSNYVQEALLTAVSGIPEGRENLFMVGDVKQSIYRFRLARPELFMEKYERFSTRDCSTQRIDLHKNFRSRGEVIDVVNDIFGRIMGKDLGNIAYDEDAALYPGGNFENYADVSCCRPECLLVEEDPMERDKRVTEARVVAQRIRNLIGGGEIPGMRYRDVVILLRSLTGWSEAFQTVFEQEGIPLLVPSQTGYFSTQEVQVILAMLRVLDNPDQDVPLTSVMRSPIGGFSGQELAKIRVLGENLPFYACVRELGQGPEQAEEIRHGFPENGENQNNTEMESGEERKNVLDKQLADKVKQFWALLESFRRRVPYTPVHTLIQQIYDETGYRDYVTAMPAGERRRANLDMLLEKAIAYEKTSYHGLFHFIRYIDRLMKYEVDYGEAETVSEQENAVRLMTIHKSKGLEFPVVILAGMGKQFNMQDERDRMIFHPEYGIGLKYFDAESRIKTDTLIRQVFSIETKKENLGEELRILYVALTRAKENLILTGMKPKNEWAVRRGRETYEKLDFSLRMDAKCYWDWVLPALSSYGAAYLLQTVRLEERLESEDRRQRETAAGRRRLTEELQQVDEDVYGILEDRLSWNYPYEETGALKQKVSVSEIKHRAMEEAREILEESGEQSLFPEEIPSPYLPKFVQAQEENIGALRGTAVHRFLECLDFAAVPDAKVTLWLEEQTEFFVREGRMRPEEAKLLDLRQLYRFLSTGVAGRMTQAARQRRLIKEQPFVMDLPANRVWSGVDSEESVLVQGIIDVFWEEEDGIVLLDYKTDRVKHPEELLARYREQLLLYAEALNRRFGDKKVKEILIYSFRLDEVIAVS
ncbi:MAG: helicase-exonuclease AddAB subunit AddA [Clostridiales bacterium]|nr:helicase-exonuclease AddAB subunit AddA [Clostridiales bacterium]